jgi:regulator of RNase E activity RraA
MSGCATSRCWHLVSAAALVPAFTMRFIPAREDLSMPDRWSASVSPRSAIEEIPAGAMVVVDAMRRAEAGILGDVFASRMKARGVAGLITDGALRDGSVITEIGLPAWCQGRAAPPSSTTMTFVEWQTPHRLRWCCDLSGRLHCRG